MKLMVAMALQLTSVSALACMMSSAGINGNVEKTELKDGTCMMTINVKNVYGNSGRCGLSISPKTHTAAANKLYCESDFSGQNIVARLGSWGSGLTVMSPKLTSAAEAEAAALAKKRENPQVDEMVCTSYRGEDTYRPIIGKYAVHIKNEKIGFNPTRIKSQVQFIALDKLPAQWAAEKSENYSSDDVLRDEMLKDSLVSYNVKPEKKNLKSWIGEANSLAGLVSEHKKNMDVFTGPEQTVYVLGSEEFTYNVNEASRYSEEYGGGQAGVQSETEEQFNKRSLVLGYAIPGYLGHTKVPFFTEGYETSIYVRSPYAKDQDNLFNSLEDMGDCSYICKDCTGDPSED